MAYFAAGGQVLILAYAVWALALVGGGMSMSVSDFLVATILHLVSAVSAVLLFMAAALFERKATL